MGAKALYTDTRRKTIHQLIINKDIEKIRGVLHDRDEYRQFSSGWQAVNLDEFIDQFQIQSQTYNMVNNLRKITFFDDGKEYAIVTAIGGKYFRIQEIRKDGRPGAYVGLDLKEPRISGYYQGLARKAERNRRTHFRMTYRRGTI